MITTMRYSDDFFDYRHVINSYYYIAVDYRVKSTLTQYFFPDLKLSYTGAMSKLKPWQSKTCAGLKRRSGS
jgi:hypothetical protein